MRGLCYRTRRTLALTQDGRIQVLSLTETTEDIKENKAKGEQTGPHLFFVLNFELKLANHMPTLVQNLYLKRKAQNR